MRARLRQTLSLSLCGLLTACSGLIVQDDDPGAMKAAKVLARVVIAVPTAGISEGVLADLKDDARNRAWRRQELPQTEAVCRRQWKAYVEDRVLRRLPDRVIGAAAAAAGPDYLGGAVRILTLAGVVPDPDSLQAEWQRTLAREPQAALLAECAHRFRIDRFPAAD